MNNTANEPIEVRLHQILSVLRVQLKDALTPQTHDHESLEFFGDSVLRERVCRYIINSRYKHLDSRNFNLMIQSCICNKNLEMCFDVARIEELVYLPTNTIKKEITKKSDLLQTNNTPINKRSKDYLAKQNNSSPSRFNKTVTLFPIKTKADVIEALIGKLSSLMFHKNEIQYSLFKHYRLALQLILRLCVQNGEQEFLKDNYHHYQKKKKNQVQKVQQVQQNQQSFKKTKNNLNTNSINVIQPKNNNFKQNPNINLNKKAIHKPTQKQKNKNSSSISSENPIQQRFSSKKNEKFKKYNKGFNTNKKKNFYNKNQIRLSNNKNKNKNNKNNNIKNNSNNNNNKNFNNNHNQKKYQKNNPFYKKNNTQQKEKEKEKDKNQSRDLNKKSDFLNQLIENNNSKREKIKKKPQNLNDLLDQKLTIPFILDNCSQKSQSKQPLKINNMKQYLNQKNQKIESDLDYYL
ncbi:hypothetical protein M0812_00220 [Anaeramoeba flamelloides]|uniref:RNase III domain-containing protein n=1 Tax=Anaeramoeba flamelloides TaxID=1746091 RepID=A0AAV8A1T2_9EUKA|nr:hypothetical protein M0812_00220 [Anaeramoeba flamelloides]